MSYQKKITIAIATFNSAKILERVLLSIKKQTYPQELLEILLIDGGSTDSTFEIANKYACKVINNPQTEPVNAKLLAYQECSGDYLVFLDHDEVLSNERSLEIKCGLLGSNGLIKAVSLSGYKNPEDYPFINNYINEFGDPFSFFIYRLSKSYLYFIDLMKKRYKKHVENEFGVYFDFNEEKRLPIIELCAAGGMIDVTYFKQEFPFTMTEKKYIPHFFYYLLEKGGFLGITKDDYIIHYSSENLKKYFNKIKWRIKNNIFHKEDMGISGFNGRNEFSKTLAARIKKYFFIPYSLFLLPCFADAVYLAISRKNYRYFIHVFLCVYTSLIIIGYYILKLFGFSEDLRSYDNMKIKK